MKAAAAAAAAAVRTSNRFERRRERTRQELLAAATRVLAEKGLDRTKVTDIAAAADVGVGTFYLHFADKEALFDAVVEETVRRLKATVDAAREKARGPLAKIQAANRAFFPLPPALVAQAVVGMATQVISWWTEHESVPIETLIETTTALALHGITSEAPAKGARHG